MTPLRTVIALTAAMTLFPAALSAQQRDSTMRADTTLSDTIPLEPLVVTATRIPLARDAVPAAVTVIGGDELRARGARLLTDALRLTPGTPVAQSGSFGGLTSVFVRGGESDYVQVLIDGVPANDPGGSFDFAHLRVEDVERIEIVRGPVSVLYGSDAVTGVVHVITRRGAGRPVVRGSVSGGHANRVGTDADGSYGTVAFDAGVSGSTGPLSYAASAAHFDSEGAYAFNNDYVNTHLGGRLGIDGAAGSVALTARWTDHVYHFPTDGAGNLVDANQYRTGTGLVAGLAAERALGSRIRAVMELGYTRNESAGEDAPDSPGDTLGFYATSSRADSERRSADGRFDITLGHRTSLTLGAAVERQEGSTASLSESQFGPFADTADYRRGSHAGYAQIVTLPHERVTMTAGTRYDDSDAFGEFVTWRTGVNVRPGDWILRAAAGTAFKEPTFYENFAQGFVVGNPDLAPERSLSFEVGAERSLLARRVTLGVTAYSQRFRDLIQYAATPLDDSGSNYFNLGEAQARGLEMTAALRPHRAITLDLAWDWLDTEVVESGNEGDATFVAGERLLRRPEHRLTADASWSRGSTRFSLGATRVGQREDIDFADPTAPAGKRATLDAYTLVNLAGEFPLLRFGAGNVRGTVRVENVFDARFEEIVNFPARGRVVYLGARARLGF